MMRLNLSQTGSKNPLSKMRICGQLLHLGFVLLIGPLALAATPTLQERLVQNLGCPWNFDETLKILLFEPPASPAEIVDQKKLLKEAFVRGSLKSLNDKQFAELYSRYTILTQDKTTSVREEFARFQRKEQATSLPLSRLLASYISQDEDLTPALVSFSLTLGRLELAFTEAGGSCPRTQRLYDFWKDLPANQPIVGPEKIAPHHLIKIFRDSGPFSGSREFRLTTPWIHSPSTGEAVVHNRPRLLKGAWNIMSTLYQTCSIHKQPLVNAEVQVRGILVTGKHPGGIGDSREIEFRGGVPVPEFYESHPYLKNFQGEYSRLGRARGCFDWTRNAPIYDFGGKPHWNENKLDLFTNAGTGTSALGLDCSGFVIASALASGQRLIKNQPNELKKFTESFGSDAFKSPKSSGLSCLSPFSITHSTPFQNFIGAGDLMAGRGHVLIIETVTADPFGIKRLHSLADCKAENFDPKTFGISIIHSSANNNGIGVARHDLKGFHRETYNAAFQELAVKACRAFYDPAFQSSSNLSVGVNFVRVNSSPACREPRARLALESCVDQCLFKNF